MSAVSVNLLAGSMAVNSAYFSHELDPMFAAAAMSLSSVCVVSNALRLRGWKPTLTKLPSTDENNKHPTIIKEETKMKTMTIKGMMCAHCSGRVEKALNDLPGVAATVNLEAGTASVQGDVSNEVLTKAVTDAGYEVVSIA